MYVVTTEPNLKKFTEGNVRKPAFLHYVDNTKIRKAHVGHAWLFI